MRNNTNSVLQTQEFKTIHFCSGIGGCTLGMQQSAEEYRGVRGTFRTLYGIDVDPIACEAYEQLTGSRAINRDMFDREQYIMFHGKEPPEDWREIVPPELREWAGGEYPDVIFISAPCKGFSRLLPNAAAQKPKYQALNKLALRSITLAMEAWGDDLPAVILFENVPGIETRGKQVLEEIRAILSSFGYVFHEGRHDCGEIGQLGQKRIRYLMIARLPRKLPSFIYQPPKFKLRSIGEVLGPLPMPGDTERGGRMHRLPNLAWKTWERLALIPAGKDWRALKDLAYSPQNGAFRILPWDIASTVVTGEASRPSNASSISVADPRLGNLDGYGNKYAVSDWETPGPTVIGNRVGGGGLIVNDPRVSEHEGKRPNAYQVEDWSKPTKTIIGQTDIQTGALSVADPRPSKHYNNIFKVCDWNEPSASITGGGGVMSGGLSIADPRISEKWSGSGPYGVMDWDKPANTVSGSASVDNSPAAVADPRIPEPDERGCFVIIALDGTWHRPITTYEMAMLQGLPPIVNGKPFELPCSSDAKCRELIGNLVPVPAAWAMGNALLRTMLPSYVGDWHWNTSGCEIWVAPELSQVCAGNLG